MNQGTGWCKINKYAVCDNTMTELDLPVLNTLAVMDIQRANYLS